MEMIKKKTLWERALPFIYIWNHIDTQTPFICTENQVGTPIPIKITNKIEDVFSFLRDYDKDFLMVDAINPDMNRLKGLICINGCRELATIDDCFFIGEMHFKNDIFSVVLSTRQFIEYLGPDTNILICKMILSDIEDSALLSAQSLFSLSGGIKNED